MGKIKSFIRVAHWTIKNYKFVYILLENEAINSEVGISLRSFIKRNIESSQKWN